MTETTPPVEHRWVTILRRKLQERGFEGDRLAAEMNRMMERFPFLRDRQHDEAPDVPISE